MHNVQQPSHPAVSGADLPVTPAGGDRAETLTTENIATENIATEEIANWLNRLRSESLKQQLQVVQELAQAGEAGWDGLMQFLAERTLQQNPPIAPTPIEGKVYQLLRQAPTAKVQDFLNTKFPHGLVPLASDKGIDYSTLQQLLANQDFLASDRLTLEKMCELAGAAAIKRKWLYFSEVEQFPITDLHTINQLWLVYSEGKFGFSVQRELWLATGQNWDRLWELIQWRSGNNWTRYPQDFIWDLSAPRGHLPLSNQLRGVRVIASLMAHPAWNN